jgi:hypothetical protein
LTSDRVYRWRLILEEFAPEIIYIKGIHNTVADASSRLEYNPTINATTEQNFANNVKFNLDSQRWKEFATLWRSYNENNPSKHQQECNLNNVLANHSDEEEIYPLTAQEVADAQKADATLKHCFKSNHVFDKGVDIRLVDDTSVVCNDGRMIIPKPLQGRAVMWYHHYLQHPGHTRLEETMQATMYWKGMRITIQSITKSCKACEINKKRKLRYGHLPPKTIIMTPWRTLCVHLVGRYTLKGKDGSIIDFMALTKWNCH